MKFRGSGTVFHKFLKHYKKAKQEENRKNPKPTPEQIANAKKFAQKLMRPDEKSFSPWEQHIRKKFGKSKLEFDEKFRKFPLEINGEVIDYIPDFILKDFRENGKSILIEAHQDLTEKDVKKFRLFMNKYGSTYHLIMIVQGNYLQKWNELDQGEQTLFHDIWVDEDVDIFIKTLLEQKKKHGTQIHLPDRATCPLPKGCGKKAIGEKEVEKLFGYRQTSEKTIVQSYCRRCRAKHKKIKSGELEKEIKEFGDQYNVLKNVYCTGCGQRFLTRDPSQSHCSKCLEFFRS